MYRRLGDYLKARWSKAVAKSSSLVLRHSDTMTSEAPPLSLPRNGRHPLFGALKGSVRIPPGIDLTVPADPDWGEVP